MITARGTSRRGFRASPDRMSISAAPPTSQATIASGPAICAATMAPSSQPEPITPLKPIAVSCQSPRDLRR